MGAYVEAAEDQFDYETDWLEVAEDRQPSSAHFADTAQEDTIMGFVPWNKRRSALRFFKGFAYPFNQAGGPVLVPRLHREQPHRHPDYPWMRAFDVSFQGTQLLPNQQNANNSPFDTTVFTVNPVTRRTKYKWAMFAVKYRAFGSMKFLADEDILVDGENGTSEEWKRNVLWLPPAPNSEALTVTGGLSQLTFSEGGGAPQPTAGTTRFAAPLAELQTKVAFRLLWMGVPWEYLSETDPGTIFWPQKILNRIGRVNNDSFLEEFSPETVRMLAPEFEIFPWWVPSEDVDDPDLGDSLLAVNVTLSFEWFDPTTGINPPFRHGWNNMPWGGDGKVNGDGHYYRATRDGTNAGKGLLEAVDFMPMFTHISS